MGLVVRGGYFVSLESAAAKGSIDMIINLAFMGVFILDLTHKYRSEVMATYHSIRPEWPRSKRQGFVKPVRHVAYNFGAGSRVMPAS